MNIQKSNGKYILHGSQAIIKGMKAIMRKIGKMDKDQFEAFSIKAMKAQGYAGIRSGLNHDSKTTKGTPDAYVELPNGNYIAFQFTSTKKANIKSKLRKDIDALSSTKCHFKDKIEKVVLCFACNLNSEIELFKNQIEKKGWKYDLFSLDRLAELCADDQDLLPIRPNRRSVFPKNEPLYDCGERIKEIRKDIGLSESEFKEHLQFVSNKEFISIENKEKEAPISLLNSIVETTGVSLDWLKHGTGGKYPYSMVISTHDKETLQEELEGKNIEWAYYCLVPKGMNLALIVQLSDFRWKTILFNFDLCFWGWMDGHSQIPNVLNLIWYSYSTLSKQSTNITGRIIDRETYNSLFLENIFLGKLVEKLTFQGNENYWIDDLFVYKDLLGGRQEAYENWYGDWFTKLQQYLVKCDV